MRIVFLSYHYSPDIPSPREWLERIKYYTGWAECLAKKHTVIRVDQINYAGEFHTTAFNIIVLMTEKEKIISRYD